MYQSGKEMANWQRFALDACEGYVALSVREGVPAAAGRRAAGSIGGGSAGPMSGYDIIVVGFSAGGIDPVLQMVEDGPSDFPAAVFVVHHSPAQSISAPPRLLSRTTVVPAAPAVLDAIAPSPIELVSWGHAA